ncbi:MAG TPA: hypothetical protein DEP45_12520 [Armatimonadetes bacterium]|nr:hypothetical protein [Armatimonadota bacterium]
MRIMLSGVAIEGGGAERVIQDLARGLAARGHEVMIVFLESTDEVVPELEALGIRCERLLPRRKLAKSAWADFTPSSILAYRRLIADFRPEIIHSHVPRPTLWASLALRMLGRRPPLVYTEHSIQEVYPRWAAGIYRTFLPVTAGIVCVSDAARVSFSSRWSRYPGPIRRIWNGIETGRIASVRSREDVHSGLCSAEETRVLCNVANLTRPKSQITLVEAMSLVPQDGLSSECWIAGSFEHEPQTVEAIRGAIAEHNLEGAVKLLGRRRDVPDLLNAADIFVLSSRQEGFPITILEAMAAGKPVIATDVGGCAEAVVDGETGLIVPPEDPQALAEAISALISDPERARSMGEAGHRRVEREFTVDRMVEQHLELYQSIIDARG